MNLDGRPISDVQTYEANRARSTNPKDAVGRSKIGFFAIVPLTALVALAKVMTLGAAKYGALNFRQANVAKTVYLDGILRHAMKLAEGEEIDPESGETHWAHIMAGAAIGHDAAVNGMLVNDLPALAGNTDLVAQLSQPYTPPSLAAPKT